MLISTIGIVGGDGDFLADGAHVDLNSRNYSVTPIRVAALIFFTALQVACSRPSAPPDAAPAPKHASSEEQALDLLVTELKAHKVDGLDCLSFASGDAPAESKVKIWEFQAREIHDKRCGGDPEVAPLRDTYRISSEGQVWAYDVVNDKYKPL
jgi:hypothetical protein